MKFFYLLLCLSLSLFFTSCTSALNHFQKDPQSARAIQYTKKADLVYNTEIKAMLFVTYLNKTDNNFDSSNTNTFLVGTHFTNKDNHDFLENDFQIQINNQEELEITKLDQESKLISVVPLKNKWASYYLVEIKNTEDDNFNISLLSPTLGKISVNFQK